MSGFLRNLVRRTLAPGSALHSLAALPYAQPSVDRELPTPPDPTAVGESHRPPSPGASDSPRTDVDVTPADRRIDPQADGSGYRSDPPTRAAVPLPSSRHTVGDDDDVLPALPRRSAPPPQAEPAERTTIARTFRDFPPLVRQHDEQASRVSTTQTASGVEMAPAEVAARPGLTLPRRQRSPRESVAPAPARTTYASENENARRADSTEVHVSIGRIEVTAVTASPAPKRKTAASKKPMSLDEYLAKRGGERR